MKKNNIAPKLAAAAMCAVLAAGLAGCSSTDNGGSDSKPKGSSDSPAESVIDGKKVEVYLAEDGTPYYINEDGEKMMLFATPFADELDDDDDEYDYDEGYDYTQDFIRGSYSVGGLEFTIPDGWFADSSLGSPTLFEDIAEGEDINFDQAISIVPTFYVFDSFENGEADEEAVDSYFKELTDAGFYTDYELLGSGEVEVCGMTAKYFDIKGSMPMESEEETEVFRTRYIITPGENSHCFILSSLDTDESAEYVQGVFDSLSKTLKLPTAEEMNAADEDLEYDNAADDIDEDIEPVG